MSMLKQQIFEDMKNSMRSGDSIAVETLRMVRSSIQRKEIDEKTELDDNGVLQVIQKMIKQCNDSYEQFTNAGRETLAEKEMANIKIMEKYLPEQLSDEEVTGIVQKAIMETSATSMKDMGRVMGIVKSQMQGQADMKKVSAIVRQLLN